MKEILTPSARLLAHAAGEELRLHHLTVLPRQPLQTEDELLRLYRELMAEVQGIGIHVLQEKVYGEPEASPSVAAARREALGRRGHEELPYTLVGSSPCQGGIVAGVQLCGVSGPLAAGACRTLRHGGRPVGRLLETGRQRMAFLADVVGADPDGEITGGASIQCERMFRRAARLVEDLGFRFRDVARTWIYARRVLDWYGELNRVRSEVYKEVDALDPDDPASLPASTGIQAAHPRGAECFMDLVVVEGPGSATSQESICSVSQCEAASYGSAFSRGKKVHFAGRTLLFLSGTASIDSEGRTAHVEDPEGQIVLTMDTIRELLATEGADMDDIATSVLFFKDRRTYERWQELARQGRVLRVPGLPVYGDVCRDDLLFEVEPTAVPG